MKTITLQRISTSRENLGEVLDEVSFEVEDDDEERVDWKPAGYYSSEQMGMSGLPDFILPQVLALIAIVFAIIALVMC